MIYSLTVTNYLGDQMTFELANPWLNGLAITKITGLGAADADINVTEIATGDGGKYNSSRVGKRNVVITFLPLLTDSQTVEDSRQLLYQYFHIKKQVTLHFSTDNREVEIVGYVEKNDPDIFSNEEDVQISVLCPDPYFYDMSDGGWTTVTFSGVNPLFEFPFENNSLTENLIEFGEIKKKQKETVTYEGDAEIGFIIRMHALGEVRMITIYDTDTRESMHIDTNRLKEIVGSEIKYGDDITINTIMGERSVMFLRDGVETNILNALDKDADWFTLKSGDNHYAYVCDYGSEDLEFSIEFKTAFEGI